MRMDTGSGPDAVAERRRRQVRDGCERAVRSGAELYDRARHLPRLARATPQEIASGDPAVARIILGRLLRALRAERRRGRAGHWSYDLNRHIALMQAIVAERVRLGDSGDRGGRTGQGSRNEPADVAVASVSPGDRRTPRNRPSPGS